MNTMTFADGACEERSRSEEEVMSVTSWRRSDKEIDAVPPPQMSWYSWDETLELKTD